MVHTICFNVFSKGNYWCFLWYLHSCPLETILPLAQIYSLEKIKCGSYHQILLFLHDKIQPLWQVLCKYNRISALDKWGSTWSRWMSHWRTVHFQTQLVHQNTASDQKHTEVQVSVSSNWSGLFQHHSVHAQMHLEVQLQLLSCQKSSGGQSVFFACPILSNRVENTCISNLTDFWKKYLPSPWVKFLRNLGTLWRYHPRKNAGT